MTIFTFIYLYLKRGKIKVQHKGPRDRTRQVRQVSTNGLLSTRVHILRILLGWWLKFTVRETDKVLVRARMWNICGRSKNTDFSFQLIWRVPESHRRWNMQVRESKTGCSSPQKLKQNKNNQLVNKHSCFYCWVLVFGYFNSKWQIYWTNLLLTINFKGKIDS